MTTVDKHKAMIDYLCTCPLIKDNPLFFNFGEAKENSNQFITTSNSESTTTQFVDGSELKLYAFTLLTFKTISYNAIVKTASLQNENLAEIAELQQIIDWIVEQEKLHNYPDFGALCNIDFIVSQSANPTLIDVDVNREPAIATYGITINVQYLDTANKVWK